MIEDLNIQEVEKVSGMFLEVFQSEPFNFDWINKKKALGYMTDLFNDSGFKGFTYKDNGKTIGYCLGSYNRNMIADQYHIKEIFIKKESQHQGYGLKMLNEIEDFLKSVNIDVITLYTNIGIPAYNFYLKNNFQVMSDTVHMLKVIN